MYERLLRAWSKEKKPAEFTPLPLESHSNPTQSTLGIPSMCSKCSLKSPFLALVTLYGNYLFIYPSPPPKLQVP